MRKTTIGVISGLAGGVLGAAAVTKYLRRYMVKQYQEKDKFCGYYMLLDDWLTLKEYGPSLEKFFKDNNYGTVAIYGMGKLGSHLYHELKDTSICVKYGIDQRGAEMSKEIEIKTNEEKLEQVDVIVVSTIFIFDEIKRKLEKRIDCPILSLEEVIYPLCRRL